MLHKLLQAGIEPNIVDDDPEETYFEYTIENDSLEVERKHNLWLFKGVEDERRPCIVCYSRGYSEARNRQCEDCGEHLLVCQRCYDMQRLPLAACPFCKVAAQDQANLEMWKNQTIDQIIPQMLLGHSQGMNFARLTQNLETVCGPVNKKEILACLHKLVKDGKVVKKGQRRYGIE